MSHVLTLGDLSEAQVSRILARASELRGGARVAAPAGRVLGLIFLEESLRTRVGYRAAAARLGWGAVEVIERRHGPTAMIESWPDTLRTVAGYCDVIVARPGVALSRRDAESIDPCALISGGDRGPGAQHPSQTLIDLSAIETLAGPLEEQHLAIVGDLRMRAVRSLLALLARRPARQLSLVADPAHLGGLQLPEGLRRRATFASWDGIGDADVVYVAGIPHESLSPDRRDALRATAERTATLKASCVILSPMPVIDEMDDAVRADPRNKMFAQSDLGLYVRMALLEHVVASDDE